uniref:linoleate 13S-lipoxygenase n=1 Tax=Zea mays TaxID=4577 RepID=C0HH76_MAIZE|nr:unknown [Zea mays]
MMNLNLKQPLVLPAHHSNVVGSRLSSSSPSAAAASRRTGGGVSSRSGSRRHVRLPRISCSATEEVSGAVSSVTVERMLTVTASVEASPAIGQMYFQRAVDDIGDLLGKTLLLELVSSELDAKSGVEKTRVTAYAHKTLREGHYEAEFKVPASFGPVGAVLVENEHHKEVFIKEIKLVTGGDSSTAVTFDCNSWVHSKFDNPEKRIFFTLKSYLPSDTPKGLEDLRKKDLQALRGDGHGERKVFERVYDYDVYNDLIKRGLAVRGEDGELELTIKDYPYAHDGLLVWDSIRQWASEYVNVYYKSDEAVAADPELRAFWDEVRNVGHGDKKDEPWWPVLDTRDSLVETLTTIMWVTSGHHSAVNFGQYHFAGYFPNRPTTIRKNMPVEEGGPGEEMEKFLKQPETTLLDMLPTQMQAIKVMTTLDILSSHSPDEEYMGEFAEPSWLAEPMVKAAFEKFGGRMKEIEGFIDECNNNLDLKNRCGAGIVPYELLKPFSKPGVTGRGIPSSISI